MRLYYCHYYTPLNSKGQTGQTLFRSIRITEPSAKVRLTKTGRLNNTFITCREAGGQVHVKSITREVSSDQLISPHARHTLLEIYAEDVLILLVLPFSQSAQTRPLGCSRRCKTTPAPPPYPIKQNKPRACQNNPGTFVCADIVVCTQPVIMHCYSVLFTTVG